MPPKPQQRPPAPGSAGASQPGQHAFGGVSRPGYAAGDGESSDPSASLATFFAAALEGAMALVRADGGEIATFDDTRQVLVLRARRTRPRLDVSPGPIGMPARGSQPLSQLPAHPGASSATNFAAPLTAARFAGAVPEIPDEITPLDEIDIQSTQLLPATLNTRTYRKGERMIGLTWERGEPIILRGEECRALPGGSAPPDPDAPWHLAAPILLPSSLAVVRPNTGVIGVISLYNKDPLWSFSARDVELLALHADRVARAMVAAELTRQSASQADLMSALVSDFGDPSPHSLYPRLRDIVRRRIDAPSFAVLLYHPQLGHVSFEIAERDGQAIPMGPFPASALPPWWRAVSEGQSVRVSAPEEHALHPEMCILGWGDDVPVQSILATPLLARGTVLGAMVAGSPRPDVYAPEHTRLFTTIAHSAAILIQNEQLRDHMWSALARSRAKEMQLSLLNNAVVTLTASLDVNETLRSLVQQSAALTAAQICAAFLYDDAHEYLIGRAVSASVPGLDTPISEIRVPAGWRDLDKTVGKGQFLLMDQLEQEWDDDSEIGRLLKAAQLTSCLALPIVNSLDNREVYLGALIVYTPGQRHHFTPEEIGLLQGLVRQGAVALTNAQLFERQQEYIRKQQELEKMKDDFVLTVSHEFRTPLTSIEGYVGLINRHWHNLDQGKLDQFAGEIRQATKQLMEMIERLNAANTVEDQQLPVSMQPMGLRAAAEEAIAIQVPEAKARMMLEVPPDLQVLADPDKVTSVFSNLLSNAIKYSPASKPVQISARGERRSTLARQQRQHAMVDGAPEHWVVASVRDWGEGISTEDQAMLFQKFVRLPRSLTTSVRGTGLGLWICRRYLEVMGGDIWVESEYGAGACFQFSLPLAQRLDG